MLNSDSFVSFYDVPEQMLAEDIVPAVPGVKGIFLRGADYRGDKSYFFAWYGFPENYLPDGSVPAIVLVHGVKGTAYSYWVKEWNKRGYAAIAMDISGGCPGCRNGEMPLEMTVHKHRYTQAPHSDTLSSLPDIPFKEQWPYRAVAAIISSHSFLRSLPGVDSKRIGICGISLGGFSTLLSIGFDNRFRFAMPIYGCGGSEDKLIHNAKISNVPEDMQHWKELWSPLNYIEKSEIPILLLNGTRDFVFDSRSWELTASKLKNPYRSMKIDFPHGQSSGSKAPELPYFADCILTGRQWPSFSAPKINNDAMQVKLFNSPAKITNVSLVYTRASGYWSDVLYRAIDAKLDDNVICSSLPRHWQAAYFMIEDENGCVYSSKICFRDQIQSF